MSQHDTLVAKKPNRLWGYTGQNAASEWSEVTLPSSLVKVFLGTQPNSDLPTIQRHERTALSINYGQKGDEGTEAYFT